MITVARILPNFIRFKPAPGWPPRSALSALVRRRYIYDTRVSDRKKDRKNISLESTMRMVRIVPQ
jgi:hypothetical protein